MTNIQPPVSHEPRSCSASGRAWQRVETALLPALLPFCLGACAGLGAMIPAAMQLGKNLLDTAAANYSPEYGDSIKELIDTLLKAKAPAATSAAGDRSGGKALAIELAVLKEDSSAGETRLVAVEDGAALHDDGGSGSGGDKFKISISSNQRCYVYVVAIDGTGWVTPVFPGEESAATNPVDAGRSYLIPEGTRWYALDENRGIEHVYLLASFERREDIERLQTKFAQTARPVRSSYRQVEQAAIATRGIVAVGPGAPAQVASENGEEHEVTPTSFLAEMKGFDLVVTRWFKHE